MKSETLYRVAIGARMDAKMVHDYIAAFGLDPRPTKQHRPVRLRDKGWSLLVETYEWGRVCVAVNKQTATVTWVEHGSIPEGLPHWAAAARHRFNNPGCVGHHEPGDPTCDGLIGPGAEPPCVWRNMCRKIQIRSAAVNTTPERTIWFMAADDDAEGPPSATQYRSVVLRPTQPTPDAQSKQEVTASSKPGSPRPRIGFPHDPYVYAESRAIAKKMMAAFARAIPVEFAGEYRHRCHAGGMFYRDRLRRSDHYVMYVRKNNAKATPLAVMYLYPSKRQPMIKIQLVAPDAMVEMARAVLPKTLRVKRWKDARRPTVIEGVEERHVSQVARVLARIIKSGDWPRITESIA